MFKLSAKNGNIIVEMDLTTASAALHTLWEAIDNATPAELGLSPEKLRALDEVKRELTTAISSKRALLAPNLLDTTHCAC